MNPQPAPITIPADFVMPWWLDLLTFAPILIVLAITVYFLRQGYSGFSYLRKQSDFLDHQKDVSQKALEQNKTFEDMIATQYRETNERADRALAQSDEAIRLHSAALDQLVRMNETLQHLARQIEVSGAAPASGGSATT